VRNEEELQRVNEERSIVQTAKRMKTDWIGYTFRRKCLLKNIDERIQGTGRRGRKYKQLLDDLKERRRC
jgi:hypothetical protein